MKSLILLIFVLLNGSLSFAAQVKSCANLFVSSDGFPALNLPTQSWKIFKQDEIDNSNNTILTLNLSRLVAVEFSNPFYGHLNVAFRKSQLDSDRSSLRYRVIFSGNPYNSTSERRANWLDATTVGILDELGLPYTRDQLLRNGLLIDFRSKEDISAYLNRLEEKIQSLERNS